jgi:hypothetical protein
MPITVLHTTDGVLDAADQPALTQLTARLAAGQGKALLYLHGGLVDQANGESAAQRLSGAGSQAFNAPVDWEQIYVVWRTGALETIRTHWTDLATNDRLYRALLNRLLGYLAGKLRVPDGSGRSVGAAAGLSPAEISARLSGRAPRPDHPFADVDEALARGQPAGRGVAIPAMADADIVAEFATALQLDPDFTAAAEDIDAALNPPIPGARAVSGHGNAAAGIQSLRRLDPAVRTKLETVVPAASARLAFTSFAVVKELVQHGAAIALRVIGRYRNGTNHGIQATIVEELARELYGDLVGATVWGMMKKDASDHFLPGRLGSQLLTALTAVADQRILVVGHSAGTIWATELLRSAAAMQQKPKLDLVFLAPAVRVSLFADVLRSAGPLVSRFRCFAMQDELERADAVLGPNTGFIYPSSLLYLVCGLFEEANGAAEVDAPLLGMARFFPSGQPAGWITDATEQTALANAVTFFGAQPHRTVYSKINDGPGLWSEAASHTAFNLEQHTLESVATFFV